MTRRALASLLAIVSLAGVPSASAKLLSLELRCPCTRPSSQWQGHAAYVRCVRNAFRYLRLEAQEWGTCEQPDTWGRCRDVACLALGEVCGCDGRLYPRPCDAILAGTQVQGFPLDGECPRP